MWVSVGTRQRKPMKTLMNKSQQCTRGFCLQMMRCVSRRRRLKLQDGIRSPSYIDICRVTFRLDHPHASGRLPGTSPCPHASDTWCSFHWQFYFRFVYQCTSAPYYLRWYLRISGGGSNFSNLAVCNALLATCVHLESPLTSSYNDPTRAMLCLLSLNVDGHHSQIHGGVLRSSSCHQKTSIRGIHELARVHVFRTVLRA